MEQPKRRRAQSRVSPETDDTKKRGRPRVEKSDESAADRRRTQIRMAQRAYRQRKESTLDELRSQVTELSNTIEQMNKVFTDCRDRLAAGGLSDVHLRELRDVSVQFEHWVRSSRRSGDNETTEPSPAVPSSNRSDSKATAAPLPVRQTTTQPKNVASWMDNLEVDRAARENPLTLIKMGYSVMDNDEKLVEPNPFDFQVALTASNRAKPQPDLENYLDTFNIDIPGMDPLHNTMPVPRTYSFQETTFGRRLHRACLESGYHLLIHPDTNKEVYDRVFRLSMMTLDRNKLIASMRKILDRGPHEPLELFEAAQIRIGGAGTHYPRRDHLGNVYPRAETFDIGSIDASTLAILHAAAKDTPATDMTVNLKDYEGEWFDPYDVEGYLAEKGIFIDPSSTFAEIDISALTPATPAADSMSTTGSTVTGGLPSPHTPTLSDTSFGRPMSESGDAMNISSDTTTDFGTSWSSEYDTMGFTNIGFSDASTGSWMNFLQPGEATKMTSNAPFLPDARVMQLHTPTRTTVLIDVTKFIKGVGTSGICIGRTPGFRRAAVDRALQAAVVETS